MTDIKRMEKPTDLICEKCGKPLVIKWGKHGSFFACSTYDKENPDTCKFTRENPINLPDVDKADLQETAQEEYCENCGRAMVLKRVASASLCLHGISRLQDHQAFDQGKRVPDIPLEEKCPDCGRNMIIRHGRFGEFTSCSGYPECKYREAEFYWREVPDCAEKASLSRSGHARATHSTDVRAIRSASSLQRPSRFQRSVRIAGTNF